MDIGVRTQNLFVWDSTPLPLGYPAPHVIQQDHMTYDESRKERNEEWVTIKDHLQKRDGA